LFVTRNSSSSVMLLWRVQGSSTVAMIELDAAFQLSRAGLAAQKATVALCLRLHVIDPAWLSSISVERKQDKNNMLLSTSPYTDFLPFHDWDR
jgi:hypothetical protein